MMSAGIKSGVNWMRLKSSATASANVRTSGLAEPRHSLQERMAADEQAGQNAMHDLVVTDDHLTDLGFDAAVSGTELVGPSFHRRGGHRVDPFPNGVSVEARIAVRHRVTTVCPGLFPALWPGLPRPFASLSRVGSYNFPA